MPSAAGAGGVTEAMVAGPQAVGKTAEGSTSVREQQKQSGTVPQASEPSVAPAAMAGAKPLGLSSRPH